MARVSQLLLLTLTALTDLRRRRCRRAEKKKRNRKVWVKPHILEREDVGAYQNRIGSLRIKEEDEYKNFLRMPPYIFDWLLQLVSPIIEKQNTTYRASTSLGERLAVTLRFLATGETYQSLHYMFRLGSTTIGRFVPEVCQAIYDVLKDENMKCPSTPAEWRNIAELFQERWILPNCRGALDGKHVTIAPPSGSGSHYYNYKHTFRIVLMALVDEEYKFIYMNAGCNGRVSDGGVFEGCSPQQAVDRRSSMFPKPAPCPGDKRPISCYVCADDAIWTQRKSIKPFSYKDMLMERRIYNYRLSRAKKSGRECFRNHGKLSQSVTHKHCPCTK